MKPAAQPAGCHTCQMQQRLSCRLAASSPIAPCAARKTGPQAATHPKRPPHRCQHCYQCWRQCQPVLLIHFPWLTHQCQPVLLIRPPCLIRQCQPVLLIRLPCLTRQCQPVLLMSLPCPPLQCQPVLLIRLHCLTRQATQAEGCQLAPKSCQDLTHSAAPSASAAMRPASGKHARAKGAALSQRLCFPVLLCCFSVASPGEQMG